MTGHNPSAIAVPNGFQSNGLPAGVTLLAPAFHDPLIGAIAAAFHADTGLTLGATDARLPPVEPSPAAEWHAWRASPPDWR